MSNTDTRETERPSDPKPRRIPALVLSGFLGSGKTTVVQRILADAQKRGVRIALISNELGELGIDRALLGPGGQSYVELEGGCVCCELSDDLLETLTELQRDIDPDRFVIETSGVALPYDTQLNFWREPACDFIGDDMAVVVVNADQIVENRDLEGTFEDQVQSADLLILNKMDLVPEADHDAVEARLREIESEAPIVRAVRGEVDPDLLFPPDAGELDRRGKAPAPHPHTHEQFETSEWNPAPGIPSQALEALFEGRSDARDGSAELVDAPDCKELLRAKGFVETLEGIRLVQVVGRRIEISEPTEPPPAELIGRVVLIRRSDRSDPSPS